MPKASEIFELDEHYQILFHRWDARSPLVRNLIEALYERDYSYFITVMEDTSWGVESDLEEAAFRMRNARLQDRGFPDYYEAQEIYRPAARRPTWRRAASRSAARRPSTIGRWRRIGPWRCPKAARRFSRSSFTPASPGRPRPSFVTSSPIS